MNRRNILTAALALTMSASLAACVSAPPPDRLSGDQQAELAQVGRYLNDIHSLRARFAQQRNGEPSSGTISLQRPGQLRLQYDPPSPNVLVANKGHVVFADLSNGGQTEMRLSHTPLAMLLGPTIQLSGDVTVVSVRDIGGQPVGIGQPPMEPTLAVTLRSTKNPGQGTLTLYMTKSPLTLKGIEMVDARNNQTALVLRGQQLNAPIDPAQFNLPRN